MLDLQSRKTVDPDRAPRVLRASLYPKEVWYFLGTFIALVSLCHFISLVYGYSTRRRIHKTTNTPSRHHLSWRRLPIAILNLFRAVAFRWSFTLWGSYTFNVADFILSAMYIAALLTWTFINTENSLGRKYDPKYWANRCGHIAAVQLPLIAALGMKNNFISFLTGVSFDRLEYLHRLTARVVCVLFWVHGFGRVSLTISDEDTSSAWLRVGAVAASALTLLCFLSIRPLRSRAYGFFLVLHLVLGVLALAGTYVHVANFGYQVYVWPALFLWGLDRVLRLVRALLVNTQLFSSSRRLPSNAKVSTVSPHFLEILVDAPPYLRWRPGQCVYLTLFGVRSPVEAHPFTIAYTLPAHDGGDTPSEKRVEGSPERLVFIVRVRAGFTRRLLDLISTGQEGSREFKALVDGPYSHPPVVRGFERVVFICGGSGVSFCLSLFLDLIQAARANANPRCCRILFVWMTRDRDQIDWIKAALTSAISASQPSLNIDIDIRLHLTAALEDPQTPECDDGEAEASADGTETPTSDEKPSLAEYPLPDVLSARLIHGRPEIKRILHAELEQATDCAVSVNVCGTPALAASVRGALAHGAGARFLDVLKGGPSVVLHVEGFGSGGSG